MAKHRAAGNYIIQAQVGKIIVEIMLILIIELMCSPISGDPEHPTVGYRLLFMKCTPFILDILGWHSFLAGRLRNGLNRLKFEKGQVLKTRDPLITWQTLEPSSYAWYCGIPASQIATEGKTVLNREVAADEKVLYKCYWQTWPENKSHSLGEKRKLIFAVSCLTITEQNVQFSNDHWNVLYVS